MILEVIRKRQSVRIYQDKEIPEEILNEILETGRLAASASNRQDMKLLVIKDRHLKQKLVPACRDQKFIGEASVVIVGCATNPERIMLCGEHSYPIDLAIALDHMSIQAVALGLGTCWIGAFYQDEVKKILMIPKGVRVVALMPLGFPKELRSKAARKPLSEIVCYDKYST